MSNGTWLLKRKRYDGSDTVITRYSIKAEAEADRDMLNKGYQSEQYYVEPYDKEKAKGFTSPTIVHDMQARLSER